MPKITHYLNDTKKEVEQYLESLFPENFTPHLLGEAMRYSMLGGGKRIRAILAITGCRILGGEDANVFPYAAALELIHAYSLIHDDLPAMDNDDFRRGKLTTHKKFGEAMGILTGDALLTHAFWVIATKTEDKEVVGSLVETLSWLSGLGGMVSGQVADILTERKASAENLLGKDKSAQEVLDYIHNYKTAALLSAACKGGAIAAKASEDTIQKFTEYGKKIGLAFQVVDDILDVIGSEEKMGKKVAKDLDHGKLTYPGLWGLDVAKAKAKQLIEEAQAAIASVPNNQNLKDIANFIIERDF